MTDKREREQLNKESLPSLMQVWDLGREREEKSGTDREILPVDAICNILVRSTGMFKARTAWERGYTGNRNGPAFSQSLTQATWRDHGVGLKMEVDAEYWRLLTNCTIAISQICFFLKGYKNSRWPWMLLFTLCATLINLSINVQDSTLTKLSRSFFL